MYAAAAAVHDSAAVLLACSAAPEGFPRARLAYRAAVQWCRAAPQAGRAALLCSRSVLPSRSPVRCSSRPVPLRSGSVPLAYTRVPIPGDPLRNEQRPQPHELRFALALCSVVASCSMCIKRVGVEIALMQGSRPIGIWLHVHTHDQLLYKLPLKHDHFPVHRRLAPAERHLLDQDKRKRGEHRPKRLLYAPCHRAPYTFYSATLPGEGLLPEQLGCLVLWMHLYDAGWPWAPLFHFKCSTARVHPITKRTHWMEQPHWTPATNWGRTCLTQEETPCGCGVRVRMQLERLHRDVVVCNR